MAVGPYIAPIPRDVIRAGYVVQLEAVDPATGDVVGGVYISDATIYVRNLGGSSADDQMLAVWLQPENV